MLIALLAPVLALPAGMFAQRESVDGSYLPNAASARWLTNLSSHFVSSRQTSITVSYRFYTVISQGVPLSRDISISSYGLSYLIAFSGVWGGLSQREICQLENNPYCH